MKKNHLLQLMYGVLILVVITTTAQSCNAFKTWFGTGGDFDRKHVRAERKALREEYLADWRRGALDVLENTYVIGTDGKKRKLKKRK